MGASVIEEHVGTSATVIKQHVWGLTYIDELIETTVDGTSYYAVLDSKYCVLALLDTSGGIKERYEYTPQGERQVFISAGANDPKAQTPMTQAPRAGTAKAYALCDIGFQGLMHDEVTGNIYQRAREYSPRLARFLQRDPFGYPDGLNSYAAYHVLYGGLDPWGLELVYHRHHKFPVAVFNPSVRAEIGLEADIHRAENLRIMREDHHRELHTRGWNEDWQTWLDQNRNRLRNMSPQQVKAEMDRQYDRMRRWAKYSNLLGQSRPAATDCESGYERDRVWRERQNGTKPKRMARRSRGAGGALIVVGALAAGSQANAGDMSPEMMGAIQRYQRGVQERDSALAEQARSDIIAMINDEFGKETALILWEKMDPGDAFDEYDAAKQTYSNGLAELARLQDKINMLEARIVNHGDALNVGLWKDKLKEYRDDRERIECEVSESSATLGNLRE